MYCTLSEGSKGCAIYESGAIYERMVQYMRGAGIQAKIHCKMQISSIRPEIYYFFAIKNAIHFLLSFKMFLDSRKRKNTNTTLEERTWLITHAEENKKLSSAKLALDFTSKFNRPINRSTVSRILSNKQHLKSMISVDPEIDLKRVTRVISSRKAEFEADLAEILRVKFRSGNSLKFYVGMQKISTRISRGQQMQWKNLYELNLTKRHFKTKCEPI